MRFYLCLLILLFPFAAQSAPVQTLPSFLQPERTLAGIVKDIKRNTLVIEDEFEKRTRSFVYVHDKTWLRVGDYVRIYFRSNGQIIERIHRLGPTAGNGGYLYKK